MVCFARPTDGQAVIRGGAPGGRSVRASRPDRMGARETVRGSCDRQRRARVGRAWLDAAPAWSRIIVCSGAISGGSVLDRMIRIIQDVAVAHPARRRARHAAVERGPFVPLRLRRAAPIAVACRSGYSLDPTGDLPPTCPSRPARWRRSSRGPPPGRRARTGLTALARRRIGSSRLSGYALIALLLVLWQTASATRAISPFYFPSVGRVAQSLASATLDGTIPTAVAVSSSSAGSRVRHRDRARRHPRRPRGLPPRRASPDRAAGRAAPPHPSPAIIPLAILLLGIGSSMKVAIIAWACVFPMLLNTLDAVRRHLAPAARRRATWDSGTRARCSRSWCRRRARASSPGFASRSR